jgi:hypothetical protein
MNRRIEAAEAEPLTGRRLFLGRALVGGLAAAVAATPIVGAASTASAATAATPSIDLVYGAKSVAKLRMVDKRLFTSVRTAGYHAAGDGGGALYYYDSSDTTSADNGGTVIVGKAGARWKLAHDGVLSLRQFGAKGNGTTDDTAAITTWLAALPEGGHGHAAAGRYKFTQALVAPLRNRVAITGAGSQQTVFVYGGSSATIDLLTIGDGDTSLTGWSLEGFGLNSTKKMTAGTALRIKKLQNGNRLRDVSCSSPNTEKKLWDGVWFDNINVLTYEQFEIDVQNEGLIVNGATSVDSGSDLTLDKGFIAFPTVGVHVAGGFGGLYVGQVLVYGALDKGYLQDNGRVARGNRELVLSEFFVLDAAHTSNLHIDDPISTNASMQIDAFISGAGFIDPPTPGDGIVIASLPGGRVSINAAQVKSNKRHGIVIGDASTFIRIGSTTYVTDNAGYGLYSSVATGNIRFDGAALYNASGALSPNFTAVPPITGTLRNDYTGDLGMRITTAGSAVTVTKLGRWVVAGSDDEHTLRIVNATTGEDVASVMLDASGLDSGFHYAALASSVTLTASTSYFLVSSEVADGDQWYHSSTAVTPTSVATVDYPVYSTGSGFAADGNTPNTSFVPLNFLYTASSTERPFLVNE